MNITRERVRQLEDSAIKKLRIKLLNDPELCKKLLESLDIER